MAKKGQRPTLTAVIRKMQGIADSQYDGDMDRYCIAIFEKLSVSEKEVFVESMLLLHAFFDGNDRLEASRPLGGAEYSESSKQELAAMDLEDHVALERVKTMSWLAKLVSALVAILVLIMVIGKVFYGSSFEGFEFLATVFDILKLFIGG